MFDEPRLFTVGVDRASRATGCSSCRRMATASTVSIKCEKQQAAALADHLADPG